MRIENELRGMIDASVHFQFSVFKFQLFCSGDTSELKKCLHLRDGARYARIGINTNGLNPA
jgi:hypothetical protein